MNKLTIAMAVMLGLGFTTAQAAETGTLNFSGNVTTTTCGIDAGSVALTIPYSTITSTSIESLVAIGDTTADLRKNFSIKLVNCPAQSPVSVMFAPGGNNYDGNIRGFKDATAKNIAAMVYDADTNEKITPNIVTSKATGVVAGDNELKYYVSLTKYRAGVAVPAMDFSIPFNYTISYL